MDAKVVAPSINTMTLKVYDEDFAFNQLTNPRQSANLNGRVSSTAQKFGIMVNGTKFGTPIFGTWNAIIGPSVVKTKTNADVTVSTTGQVFAQAQYAPATPIGPLVRADALGSVPFVRAAALAEDPTAIVPGTYAFAPSIGGMSGGGPTEGLPIHRPRPACR